jgi:S-adenosylmethionine:tRNA ribosyltransferase-isomerase
MALPKHIEDWWRLDAYDYALPEGRIASRPASPREAARLLRVAERMSDHTVADLPGLLRPGDLLVINDTRVLPARLEGRRGIAKVGVLLLRHEGEGVWRALARPAKRLRQGDVLSLGEGFEAEVLWRDGGEVRLRFAYPPEAFARLLALHGAAPLPPYIDRAPDAQDKADYQTVFAKAEGAVAAPTAGLHFTQALLERLAARGVDRASVTLHVGAGTFLPVTEADLRRHRMHGEWLQVTQETVDAVARTRAQGGRVVAVGTTALRALETAALGGTLAPFAGETELFIHPGFRFRTTDLLFTNFHLPRSTLLVLVSAFAGSARIRAAYEHAIAQGYRFFSYGDACLLERAP